MNIKQTPKSLGNPSGPMLTQQKDKRTGEKYILDIRQI
jgi:hypothetical protein